MLEPWLEESGLQESLRTNMRPNPIPIARNP